MSPVDYDNPGDIKTDLATRLDVMIGDNDSTALDAEANAALTSLQGEERAVATADDACDLEFVVAVKTEVAATRDKVLSPSYRVISGLAAAVVVLAAWVVAARGDLVAKGPFSDRLLTGATWFIAAYLVVDAVSNISSASAAKRWIGGTAKTLVAVLCIIVALRAGTT